jgi:hypothetical protein
MSTTVLLFLVPLWPTGQHLPFVMNGGKWLEKHHMYGYKHFTHLLLVYMDHNTCLEFTNMWLLQCPPLFCCSLFLFGPKAITCHWWGIKSKWPKKHMHGYKQCVCWCSGSILIIILILNSQICACCNAHYCFVVACSYFIHRPSFATGEEWSQSDWRNTCMSANLFLNDGAGLYWS